MCTKQPQIAHLDAFVLKTFKNNDFCESWNRASYDMCRYAHYKTTSIPSKIALLYVV